jgi:hypothetical protein
LLIIRFKPNLRDVTVRRLLTAKSIMTAKSNSYAEVPSDLQNLNQWVFWTYKDREDNKAAKLPQDPSSPRKLPASVSDWGTWGTFEEACACEGDGIGFVFSEDDPFLGIDLDDCIREDGELEAWAADIVQRIDSYTEYSPSGTGVHILARGTVPEGGCRRENLEMYDSARYFTVTGHRLPESPATIKDRQEAIEAVHAEYVVSSRERRSHTNSYQKGTEPTSSLSDDELIEKAQSAKNGANFTALWNGRITAGKSHSEADAALCSHLAFWTQRDRQQIDRLFRRSGLMRQKWDETHDSDGRTYGQMTIENTINMPTDTYTPKSEDNPTEPTTDEITLDDVLNVVSEEFDEETVDVTEAVLSATATLPLKGSNGTGLVIVGPPSSGKTTILEFFDGLDEVFYRSDSVTPAAFVSHDASKSDEELEKIDLLPKLAGKTLLSRDMSTWFAGDQDAVYENMAQMTSLMDGKGFTRDTGAHGQRGYTGAEYRFNYFGATTPLSPRAWQVMGDVGPRLVFVEKAGIRDTWSATSDVVHGANYDEKVNRVRSIVHAFISQLWDKTGGTGTVDWDPADGISREAENALAYLVELVRHGRARVTEGTVKREGAHRLVATFYDIARGHALLEGRRRVELTDMAIVGQIALSTMPEKIRPILRALLDPDTGGELTSTEVAQTARVSKPTALSRMDQIADLGLGEFEAVDGEDDGRQPRNLYLRSDFRWPNNLEFPRS